MSKNSSKTGKQMSFRIWIPDTNFHPWLVFSDIMMHQFVIKFHGRKLTFATLHEAVKIIQD